MSSVQIGTILLGCLLLGIIRETFAAAGHAWAYDGYTGPDNWPLYYPECKRNSQSPVHVVTSDTVLHPGLGPFELQGYDTAAGVLMDMQNNGHTVQVDLSGGINMTVSGGGLPGGLYQAVQFHLHWGGADDRGSEHVINGNSYPMEMHIVHYNMKYPDFLTALTQEDGLAVLGIFVEIGDEDEHFEEMISHFKKVKHKGQRSYITSFPLHDLLPAGRDVFYRYQGSLTTPPCYESVTWTVFKDTIKVSRKQMDHFRRELFSNKPHEPDQILIDDFRPLQPLNDRTVYASHLSAICPDNGSAHVTVSAIFLLGLIFIQRLCS